MFLEEILKTFDVWHIAGIMVEISRSSEVLLPFVKEFNKCTDRCMKRMWAVCMVKVGRRHDGLWEDEQRLSTDKTRVGLKGYFWRINDKKHR